MHTTLIAATASQYSAIQSCGSICVVQGLYSSAIEPTNERETSGRVPSGLEWQFDVRPYGDGADTQGGVLGTSQSAASLARVVGPAMAGALFQQFSPGAPYVVAAALALGAAACVRLRS